jgi:hypothetical protein
MVRSFCFFIWFFPLTLQAQFTYFLDENIPVANADGHHLSMPWAGGLNATQYNTMDLDGDDLDDLVLFDRMANKVITFLTVEGQYVAAPAYEMFFPSGIANWLLLRDYNCDGKKDIFTGDVLGIKVYLNVTGQGGHPEWQLLSFFSGFPGAKSAVILTEGSNNNKINLQLQYDDLPSISDLDSDGDLDIISMRFGGSGTVEFHQNLSIERNGNCDSLDFKRMTQAWGNFRECTCGEFAFNGTSCSSIIGGRTKHAGGKSLLALDLNGDQRQDLLLSEAECEQLFALPNEGTTVDALMNTFSPFPETTPSNFSFPAAYYEDVDFDGLKDLMISPNIFSKEFPDMNLRQSNYFYKNTGTNASPDFSFVGTDFLQKEMIDVGDNAVPAFADYDGDGDFDMFISRNASESFTSTVSLYENRGTGASPDFRIIDEDYLGFSSAQFYNVKIQFGDMNGDLTTDFIFTGTRFDTNITNLYFIPNKHQSQLDFFGATLHPLEFPMTYTENILVTDVNEDALPDVLAGRSDGQLEYWKNDGIKGSPSFALETETYLGFESSTSRQNLACFAADLDTDGKVDLMVGDQTGSLSIISDYRDASSTAVVEHQNIVFNPILKIYGGKNLGGAIWPVAVNLFNSNKPAIVAGNILGGLHLLRNDEGQSLPELPVLDIYPNPVSKSESLNIKSDRPGTMQIISVLGQYLTDPVQLTPNQIHQYTLPPVAAGVYLLKFTANKKSRTERFVIH